MLTATQRAVLAALAAEGAPMTVRDLAEVTGRYRATIHPCVDRMVVKRLVRRDGLTRDGYTYVATCNGIAAIAGV